MAWIERRAGGYLVRWRDGKERKSRHCATRREALSLKNVIETGSPESPSLGAYARSVLNGWNDLGETTRYRYAGMLSRHLGPAGLVPLTAVTEDDLRALFDGLLRAGL